MRGDLLVGEAARGEPGDLGFVPNVGYELETDHGVRRRVPVWLVTAERPTARQQEPL
ncbi:hypothetical protein [Streptomyces avermitilis]|uniref:hypothetical protein n=1 Tax=Streptomyces avermitilis TaxID=33903 RepID=UPI003F538E5F